MRSLSDTVKCSATLFTIQKKHFIDQQRNMNWLSELAQKEYELSSLTRTVELLFFFPGTSSDYPNYRFNTRNH